MQTSPVNLVVRMGKTKIFPNNVNRLSYLLSCTGKSSMLISNTSNKVLLISSCDGGGPFTVILLLCWPLDTFMVWDTHQAVCNKGNKLWYLLFLPRRLLSLYHNITCMATQCKFTALERTKVNLIVKLRKHK